MSTDPVGLGTEVLLHLHGDPFLMLLQGGASGNPAKGLCHPPGGGLALPPGPGPHGTHTLSQPPTLPTGTWLWLRGGSRLHNAPRVGGGATQVPPLPAWA